MSGKFFICHKAVSVPHHQPSGEKNWKGESGKKWENQIFLVIVVTEIFITKQNSCTNCPSHHYLITQIALALLHMTNLPDMAESL